MKAGSNNDLPGDTAFTQSATKSGLYRQHATWIFRFYYLLFIMLISCEKETFYIHEAPHTLEILFSPGACHIDVVSPLSTSPS